MPRRSQREAVAQRAEARLAEQRERRREAAQRGAQTRRQRREQRAGEAQRQPAPERATRALRARHSRPRAHPDLLTVAIRGHFAAKMRALSESTRMSLAKLLKDALLVYACDIKAGYEPGTSLRSWQELRAESQEQSE